MFKDNIISLDKKILNLISLPLKMVLEIIQKDEDLNYFDFKIIISDKINFSYNKEKEKDTPTEILKNEIEKFSEILSDNKIRVINIKKEENILKIYIAKEIYELLN